MAFTKLFQLISKPTDEEENEDKNKEDVFDLLSQPPEPVHPEHNPAVHPEHYPAVKPDLKGGTTNFDEELQTLTPQEVMTGPYLVDQLEEEGEEVPTEIEEELKKEKEYPTFQTSFQAFRWAKQNKEVVRIYYFTMKGTYLIRDVELCGDFWARTTLKRILVTWDETVGAIRAFRLENVQKYEFTGEEFSPKFNFSQRQHNYRKRIRRRKDKRKELRLM